jgi:NhaP-type Na+/H+ or K+/H+ antiporter
VPSVVLGLLALEQLSGAAADLVAGLLAAAVVLTVLAHGLAAEPIARRLSRPPEPATERP